MAVLLENECSKVRGMKNNYVSSTDEGKSMKQCLIDRCDGVHAKCQKNDSGKWKGVNGHVDRS